MGWNERQSTAGECTDPSKKSDWKVAAPVIWTAKHAPAGAAPEDGFGEGEALAGEGKCCGGTQKQRGGDAALWRRDREVRDASWGGHGPEEPRGVDEDVHDVHKDSFQPPL